MRGLAVSTGVPQELLLAVWLIYHVLDQKALVHAFFYMPKLYGCGVQPPDMYPVQ